jgi:hypothetical protein
MGGEGRERGENLRPRSLKRRGLLPQFQAKNNIEVCAKQNEMIRSKHN